MKVDGVIIAGYYLSSNTCHTCCVACKNTACSLYDVEEECRRCKNNQCINNDYECRNYHNCGSCRNVYCINNEKFNPKEIFTKNC